MWDMASWTGSSDSDPRVVCMEKTNIRYVTPEDIQEPVAFCLHRRFLYLPDQGTASRARDLLTEDGEVVCLIKPQFEAGREKVGKKGVVRDKAVHRGSDPHGHRLRGKYRFRGEEPGVFPDQGTGGKHRVSVCISKNSRRALFRPSSRWM